MLKLNTIKTSQTSEIEFKAVIHIIFESIAKINFFIIDNFLVGLSSTPSNEGVPKKILFNRNGKNIKVGLKIKNVFFNSENSSFFLLIQLKKRKIKVIKL